MAADAWEARRREGEAGIPLWEPGLAHVTTLTPPLLLASMLARVALHAAQHGRTHRTEGPVTLDEHQRDAAVVTHQLPLCLLSCPRNTPGLSIVPKSQVDGFAEAQQGRAVPSLNPLCQPDAQS